MCLVSPGKALAPMGGPGDRPGPEGQGSHHVLFPEEGSVVDSVASGASPWAASQL